MLYATPEGRAILHRTLPGRCAAIQLSLLRQNAVSRLLAFSRSVLLHFSMLSRSAAIYTPAAKEVMGISSLVCCRSAAAFPPATGKNFTVCSALQQIAENRETTQKSD